jgi:hypothetical protein
MGIADPTGSLPPGAVCAVVDGQVIGQTLVGQVEADGRRVAIYRSPGCLEGDLRLAENMWTPELAQVLTIECSACLFVYRCA